MANGVTADILSTGFGTMTHIEKLSGWGRYPVVPRAGTFAPASLPASTKEFPPGGPVVARGMGRAYGDCALPPENGTTLLTRWLDRFIAFDPARGEITVEAGVTLEQIIHTVLPGGWFLPVSPGTRFISVGGALAANVHGKNHHKEGAMVNFVENIQLLTGQGVISCSRTSNPALFGATLGGYGLTGIILTATLKLKRVETAFINARLVKVSCLQEALDIDLAAEADYAYSVTWLDALAGPDHLGRGIVMLGNHTRAGELPANRRARALDVRWAPAVRPPDLMPGWLLNGLSNRLFNTAYACRFLGRETRTTLGIESWFYPLDRVLDWNRFYGKAGFVEYQCALPSASAATGMKQLLATIKKARLGSFLAVYKRVGHDGVTLPFATPGFTLAIDFGLRQPRVLETLDELDRIVIDHGGRVYLAKDARMTPETFRAMYPEYPEWKRTVAEFSPPGIFQSHMSRRLEL